MTLISRYKQMKYGGGIPPITEDPKPKETSYINSVRSDIKGFYKNYLNSPNYRKRLVEMGYSKPADVIKNRLNRVNGEDFIVKSNIGSRYVTAEESATGKPSIYYDPIETAKESYELPSTIAHEYSHRIGATSGEIIGKKMEYAGLSEKEAGMIFLKNRLSNTYPAHDAQPHEVKADIDALRYKLYTDKIYDTGRQTFNTDTLKKVKERYSTDNVVNRLLSRFSEEDLITLMNSLAQNSSQQFKPFA